MKNNLPHIYHRVDSVLGYQNEDGSITVILKAPKGTIEEPVVYYDDPYSWSVPEGGHKHNWNCASKAKCHLIESDDMYTYYSFVLVNKEQRYRYFFKLNFDNREIAYGEFGFKDFHDGDMSEFHQFSFSWHNSSSGKYVGPAEWWNNTHWYQVFTDRFASSKGELKETDGKDTTYGGGDIAGIIDKLDYIKSLGFQGIYLNPVFKATSNHKYDTEDYKLIDEDFGTMEDFERLVAELKKRDMRIMLDGVFNHTGWMHPYWQDVLKNKENSKYKDYFAIWDVSKVDVPTAFEGTDFYDSGEAKGFETFANTPTMPRLNWANKGVQEMILDVIGFWAEKGIDAWRMDVGDEVSFEMWRKVKQKFTDVNPEGVILGEVWYDSLLFLQGDQFDSTMNYPFREATKNYFINKTINKEEFINILITNKYKYSWPINKGLFNMLGTHDTERIFSEAKSREVNLMIIAWLLLYPGVISWYYGDEIELIGKNGEWNRQIFDWNFDKNNPTYQLVKHVMEFRNENNKIIQEGVKISATDTGISMELVDGKVILFDETNWQIQLDKKKIDII